MSESTRQPDAMTIGRLLAAARLDAEQLAEPGGVELASSEDGSSVAAGQAPETPPIFPDYLVVREIHRGGQGVVWQAVRESTGDDFAIKVLHDRSIARPRERDRFEREAEILRELDHPNIIAVQELGVVDGRPYLVMPYVAGWPLDDYVSRNGLDVRATLELFAQVCEAVMAAHLNGVIHRDLKPSNILVDDFGVPRVLDFGLAKSGRPTAAGHSLTETGEFLGTLCWASPEQAESRPGGVDVRTDVYSLGVILYQMLTGHMPYDVSGSMREVLNRIVAAEPLRPRLVPNPRAGALDDEVETITLKCLSKERERRYQNAGDLAADIRRYLAGEAIEAKRDSALYVFGKFLGRNRVTASLVAGIALLTIFSGGLLLRLWQISQVEAAQLEARESAEIATTFAELTAQTLEANKGRLAGPYNPAVEQMLAATAGKLDAHALEQPAEEFNLRNAIADAFRVMELYQQACEQRAAALRAARAAYGDQDEHCASALCDYGSALQALGEYANAVKAFQESLEIRRRLFSPESDEVTRSLSAVADGLALAGDPVAAEPYARELFANRRKWYGENNPELPKLMKGFAEVLINVAKHDPTKYEEADHLQRDALALVRQHDLGSELVSHHLHSYAVLLREMSRLDESEAMLREAIAIRRVVYPVGTPLHYYVYVSMQSLGETLRLQQRFSEAEQLLLDADQNYDPSRSAMLLAIRCEIRERLAQLYQDWDAAEPGQGHDHEAELWRNKLNDAPEGP
ncbi:MAG: serine/threonine-protein kinase [Phycisphaerae bacterium]